MEFECMECKKLVSKDKIIIRTDFAGNTGLYTQFICKDCYKNQKEGE